MSPSGGHPTGRSAKGGRSGSATGSGSSSPHPVKDRETLAEEILELKKKIVRLTEEANVGKAKARRLEEDNKNKEKQLEALLDPSKSDEMRRTLGKRRRKGEVELVCLLGKRRGKGEAGLVCLVGKRRGKGELGLVCLLGNRRGKGEVGLVCLLGKRRGKGEVGLV